MAHAYNFFSWLVWERDWRNRMERAQLSYLSHVAARLHFAGQLLIAGSMGFIHAFFPCLVPFVAEESGAELYALVMARQARDGAPNYQAEGIPYAYQPSRWIYLIDWNEHVEFSGGSWSNHARFACWASGQFLLGAWCCFVHALLPPLFPTVAEEVQPRVGTFGCHQL